MNTHDDVSELLASYALDAVDSPERQEIEAHLLGCPRCRAELDAFRDVAAAMGNSVEPLPDGLWDTISSRLPERQDQEARPPMPRLVMDDFRETKSGGAPRSIRHIGAARRRVALAASVAIATAAVAAVLGIGLVRADNHVNKLTSAIGANAPTAVETALETPGHTVVNLVNSSHQKVVQFVTVPDGRGYLVSSKLSSLPSDHTYQLWGIIDGQPISLGLLGQLPSHVTFTMGSAKPSELSITEEPAGGSVVPSNPVVASGIV
jgi:anti-sigma-K factor RskA